MNQEIMRKAGFQKEMDAVNMGLCPICKKPIIDSEFRDELSKREFRISGLCQKCIDKIME